LDHEREGGSQVTFRLDFLLRDSRQLGAQLGDLLPATRSVRRAYFQGWIAKFLQVESQTQQLEMKVSCGTYSQEIEREVQEVWDLSIKARDLYVHCAVSFM
jgi:hypothetical protein